MLIFKKPNYLLTLIVKKISFKLARIKKLYI